MYLQYSNYYRVYSSGQCSDGLIHTAGSKSASVFLIRPVLSRPSQSLQASSFMIQQPQVLSSWEVRSPSLLFVPVHCDYLSIFPNKRNLPTSLQYVRAQRVTEIDFSTNDYHTRDSEFIFVQSDGKARGYRFCGRGHAWH